LTFYLDILFRIVVTYSENHSYTARISFPFPSGVHILGSRTSEMKSNTDAIQYDTSYEATQK